MSKLSTEHMLASAKAHIKSRGEVGAMPVDLYAGWVVRLATELLETKAELKALIEAVKLTPDEEELSVPASQELAELREVAVRNAFDCQHLRRSAIELTRERDTALCERDEARELLASEDVVDRSVLTDTKARYEDTIKYVRRAEAHSSLAMSATNIDAMQRYAESAYVQLTRALFGVAETPKPEPVEPAKASLSRVLLNLTEQDWDGIAEATARQCGAKSWTGGNSHYWACATGSRNTTALTTRGTRDRRDARPGMNEKTRRMWRPLWRSPSPPSIKCRWRCCRGTSSCSTVLSGTWPT